MWAIRLFLIVSVVLAAAQPPTKAAIFRTGNGLWEACGVDRSAQDYYSKYYQCSAYTIGALDALEFVSMIEGRGECVPSSTNVGQITDIVILFLRNNPGKRHYPAPNVVALAINEAFGCAIMPPPKPR